MTQLIAKRCRALEITRAISSDAKGAGAMIRKITPALLLAPDDGAQSSSLAALSAWGT